MTAPVITPERTTDPGTDPGETGDPDRPWVVIVWNDPVNLMSYVRRVFQKVLGHPYETAHTLMLQVHEEGRAVVASGAREQSEATVATLHAHGLWATLAQD